MGKLSKKRVSRLIYSNFYVKVVKCLVGRRKCRELVTSAGAWRVSIKRYKVLKDEKSGTKKQRNMIALEAFTFSLTRLLIVKSNAFEQKQKVHGFMSIDRIFGLLWTEFLKPKLQLLFSTLLVSFACSMNACNHFFLKKKRDKFRFVEMFSWKSAITYKLPLNFWRCFQNIWKILM